VEKLFSQLATISNAESADESLWGVNYSLATMLHDQLGAKPIATAAAELAVKRVVVT